MQRTSCRNTHTSLAFGLGVLLGTIVAIVGIPAVALGVLKLSELLDIGAWAVLVATQVAFVVCLGTAFLLHWLVSAWIAARSGEGVSEEGFVPAQSNRDEVSDVR